MGVCRSSFGASTVAGAVLTGCIRFFVKNWSGLRLAQGCRPRLKLAEALGNGPLQCAKYELVRRRLDAIETLHYFEIISLTLSCFYKDFFEAPPSNF